MVGASSAAAAVGFDKYKTPQDVFQRCLEYSKPQSSERAKNAFKWGHDMEPRVIDMYSRVTGWDVAEGRLYYADPNASGAANCGILEGDEHRFGVTLDARVYPYGINAHPDKWFGLECKSPMYHSYSSLKIKDEHMAQIQLQTAVANLQFIDYCAVFFHKDTGFKTSESIFKRVYHCPEYCRWMLPKLRQFTQCVEKRHNPQVQADVVPIFPSLRVVDMIQDNGRDGMTWNWDADILGVRRFHIDTGFSANSITSTYRR